MSDLDKVIGELVAANRILADQGVVDAFGHISVRHPHDPNLFLLSRSRSPEMVEPEDIMTFRFDGEPADGRKDGPYVERFIHCGAYEANPEVMSVVHSHALAGAAVQHFRRAHADRHSHGEPHGRRAFPCGTARIASATRACSCPTSNRAAISRARWATTASR